MDLKSPRQLAEEKLKRKELQAREGAEAWKDYQAERLAIQQKTARLRALRLAKDAADRAAIGAVGKRARGR